MGFIRLAAVSIVGAALAFAAPVAASAAPGTPSKPHPTTTTTTAPSNNAQAFAKLVIKPASVGHVSVKTATGSTFKPAKNGQTLHVGDTVQTDATGQAEIDYADTAYTRLDVNTTFTIKKLTDSQGNRQVEGSLDVGRTYNRTAALTQSQTFQQDGGGATAAVAGTAFVVTCTSATTCTFTAVIDNINLTGAGGQTKTLNPLDECVDSNGALCGTTTRLTPDELALLQWIQTNVYLDLVEHGLGNGIFAPFGGTVTVTNGVVTSFTPSTPTQGFTPPTPPPPPPSGPTIDTTHPIFITGGPFVVAGCNSPTTICSPNGSASEIVLTDEYGVNFTLNVTDTTSFQIEFLTLPTDGFANGGDALGLIVDQTHGGAVVQEGTMYTPTDTFGFESNDQTPPCRDVGDTSCTDVGTTSFSYQAIDANGTTKSGTIPIKIGCDATDDTCTTSTAASTSTSTSPPTTTATSNTPPTSTTPISPTTTTTTVGATSGSGSQQPAGS
jgi:FecR protein